MKEFTEKELRLIKMAVINADKKNSELLIEWTRNPRGEGGMGAYYNEMRALYKGIMTKIDVLNS